MEQQTQRTAQRTEQEQKDCETSRSQPKRHLPTQAVQAIQAGVFLGDLSYESLLDLAQRVGNSGMLALENLFIPLAETHVPNLSCSESEMPPFAVPDGLACETVSPPALTAGNWFTAAFDCAGLS